MSMDQKVKKTICNLKKKQRNLLGVAMEIGYFSSSMAARASGASISNQNFIREHNDSYVSDLLNPPIESAGQVATLSRVKEESGEPLFVRKGFEKGTGMPRFTLNPEAKTKREDVKVLLDLLNEIDKQ